MMRNLFLQASLFLVLAAFPWGAQVEGFLVTPPLSKYASNSILQPSRESTTTLSRTLKAKGSQRAQVSLLQSSPNQPGPVDGTDRGKPILALAVIFCIWSFSIPPEFRRAHFCMSDRCVENRSARLCYDCVTVGEWKRDIIKYYQDGGGIQWDFSIDPATKEFWSGKK